MLALRFCGFCHPFSRFFSLSIYFLPPFHFHTPSFLHPSSFLIVFSFSLFPPFRSSFYRLLFLHLAPSLFIHSALNSPIHFVAHNFSVLIFSLSHIFSSHLILLSHLRFTFRLLLPSSFTFPSDVSASPFYSFHLFPLPISSFLLLVFHRPPSLSFHFPSFLFSFIFSLPS